MTANSNIDDKKDKKPKIADVDGTKVDLTKEALKPITKIKSKEDKEFQELEVESTKGGKNAE